MVTMAYKPETHDMAGILDGCRHPNDVLYLSVGGSRQFGFNLPGSDYDIHGAHVLPLRKVLGFDTGNQTINLSYEYQDTSCNVVTHDILKYFSLLQKGNCNVLEEILSPHILYATPEFHRLRDIAKRTFTRKLSNHYLGMGDGQLRRRMNKETMPTIKTTLHIYRFLLTGIHLMRTGELITHLPALADEERLPQVHELIERRRAGEQTLTDADIQRLDDDSQRLIGRLEQARHLSHLPERHNCRQELNDLLVNIRIHGLKDNPGVISMQPSP